MFSTVAMPASAGARATVRGRRLDGHWPWGGRWHEAAGRSSSSRQQQRKPAPAALSSPGAVRTIAAGSRFPLQGAEEGGEQGWGCRHPQVNDGRLCTTLHPRGAGATHAGPTFAHTTTHVKHSTVHMRQRPGAHSVNAAQPTSAPAATTLNTGNSYANRPTKNNGPGSGAARRVQPTPG